MTQIIAYRRRGSVEWSHVFRVTAIQWASFYRHARTCRRSMEYARVCANGEYRSVL